MVKIKRRATPAQVARSLQELSLLWARPRPSDPENETAGKGRNPGPAADQSTIERNQCTAAGMPSARGGGHAKP